MLSTSPILIRLIVPLLRLLPFMFAAVFICAALTGVISVLYLAVLLHLLIVSAENTIGRTRSVAASVLTFSSSTLFEDVCLTVWPIFHLAAFVAALYLISRADPSARQVFAIAAIFGYSVNTFSAAIGHELLHRESWIGKVSSNALYAAMLYPHFPAVHLVSHHRWAGTSRDCQTPLPGQQIYWYLRQALVRGTGVALTRRAAVADRHLTRRVLAAATGMTALSLVGGWPVALFLLVQGAFSFLLVETLNYIQHYRPLDEHSLASERARLANQDLNFISRCTLFNLPLHASHHLDQHSPCWSLAPIPGAPSYCLGYWTSFWLAWTPPLWNHFHEYREEQSRGKRD